MAWSEWQRLADHATVVVADADGADILRTRIPSPSFYLSWRPDGRALVSLANGPEGIDCTLIVPGERAEVLLRGAPMFVSWSPDSRGLAVHVDGERVVVVPLGHPALGGAAREVRSDPCAFSAPAWVRGGIIADIAHRERPALALIDARDGCTVRVLARHDGWARFVPSPSGSHVAFACGPSHPGRDLLSEADEAIPEALCVSALDAADPDSLTVVTASTPLAFSWDPTGTRLLLLVAVDQPSRGELVRLEVWDGGLGTRRLCGFTPTPYLIDAELPFPEQYAQSRTWWSADGSLVCFAAQDPISGAGEIWVQAVDGESDTARPVVAGVAASFSPR